MNTWIILDTSYLIYRATYAMKDNADPLYAFFATLLSLRTRFDSDLFIFCFDRGPLKRCELLPSYKERKPDPDHEEEHKKARHIMDQLRREVLLDLGFENILSQKGYEADDLIASVVTQSLKPDQGVIISRDADFFQLLSPDVIIYNPHTEKITNEKVFSEHWYGLKPDQWPIVKAVAGCKSDNVLGIPGIGEKTAAQFLSGKLGRHTEKFDRIANTPKADIDFRLRLVELPYEGTKVFDLVEDEKIDWRRVQSYQPKVEN